MAKHSAGLLLYRRGAEALEVMLVHPGGPFWAKKDLGAWSLPKGEVEVGEDPLAAAQREFTEETGFRAEPPFLELGSIKQAGGKTVVAWACAGDCDVADLASSTFEMEWPPRSGRLAIFPEVDRAAWFTVGAARERLLKGQALLLVRLCDVLGVRCDEDSA